MLPPKITTTSQIFGLGDLCEKLGAPHVVSLPGGIYRVSIHIILGLDLCRVADLNLMFVWLGSHLDDMALKAVVLREGA